jgi:hypothetical protein
MPGFARLALASILVSAVHASAETRVCIGGDIDHMNAAQKAACQVTADNIRDNVSRMQAPSDWHFYVLCTEGDWQTYAAFSTRTPEQLAASSADTDLATRSTFFRRDRLFSADPATRMSVLVHEVAAARTQSTDEAVIRKQAALIIPALTAAL